MTRNITAILIWFVITTSHASYSRANSDELDWKVDSGNQRETYANGCDPNGSLTIDILDNNEGIVDFQGTLNTQENFIVQMKHPKTGMCRQAMMRLPKQYYDMTTIPTVYFFHGDFPKDWFDYYSANELDSAQYLREWGSMMADYRPFADVDDFPLILVSPFGSVWVKEELQQQRLGPTTNYSFGWELYDEEGGSYDEHFTRKLHEKITQKFPKIDMQRTYVSGHSSGAMFTFRAAIVMGDIFAAAAPRAGRLWGNEQWLPSNCKNPTDDGGCLSSPFTSYKIPLQYQVGDADTHSKDGTVDRCRGISDPCIAQFGLDATIFQFAVDSNCLTSQSLSNVSPNKGRSDWNWAFPTKQSVVNGWIEEKGNVDGHPFVVYEFCGGGKSRSVKYIKWNDQGHSFTDVSRSTWEKNVEFFQSHSLTPTTCRSVGSYSKINNEFCTGRANANSAKYARYWEIKPGSKKVVLDTECTDSECVLKDCCKRGRARKCTNTDKNGNAGAFTQAMCGNNWKLKSNAKRKKAACKGKNGQCTRKNCCVKK